MVGREAILTPKLKRENEKMSYMLPQLDYILWEITSKCNLECIHCRASASPYKKTEELATDKICDILNEIKQIGVKILTFSGGEPFLRDDLVDIVRYAANLDIKVRVQSNATLLDYKIIKKLKNNGLWSLGVGLDGDSAEIHDRLRNKEGAFERCVNALKLCKKLNLNTHIEYTVTPLNFDRVEDTYNLASSLQVRTMFVRAMVPAGRGKDRTDLFISKNEYFGLLKKISKINGCNTKNITNLGSQDPLYHLTQNNLIKNIKNKYKNFNGKIMSGCTAGMNMINILPNGDVGICTCLPGITIGNLDNSKLKDIWDNRLNSNICRRIFERYYDGKCGICKERFLCGGCRARAKALRNNIFGPDPYCIKRQRSVPASK